MIQATLVHASPSFSVDVEISNEDSEKLELSSDGDKVAITLILDKCKAMEKPEVYVNSEYEHITIWGRNQPVMITGKIPSNKIMKSKDKLTAVVTIQVQP